VQAKHRVISTNFLKFEVRETSKYLLENYSYLLE